MNKENRDIFSLILSSILVRSAAHYIAGGPPLSTDNWEAVAILNGKLMVIIESGISDYVFYSSYYISDIHSLTFVHRYLPFSLFSNVGKLMRVDQKLFLIADIMYIFYYGLLTIMIYYVTKAISNSRETAYLTGILSCFSIGQLRISKINPYELIGVIVFLLCIYFFVSSNNNPNKKHLKYYNIICFNL